ncbi:hypothetical protein [Agromyces sp. NPDC058110]|uniref:hypothetical protein n=1 Tax=Agromyces sp. NPDC058110 TaxID=3346345 RepID=UPI0036D8DEAB
MPMKTTPAVAVIAALAVMLGGAGCVADPRTAPPPPASTPPASTPPASTPAAEAFDQMNPDASHICGQVSALAGIAFRSDWEHEQGLIDDASYAARVVAVEQGWTTLVAGADELRAEVAFAKRAASEGGISDNPEFTRASEELAAACTAAGSLIAISALPGQGG